MASELIIAIRLKWWLPFYISGMKMFCFLTGAEPDERKVEKIVRRAIIVSPIRGK